MSFKIREGYQNPLQMMNGKIGRFGMNKAKDTDDVEKLNYEKQSIQNSIILIKSTGSDTAEVSAETIKKLEDKLDEVSAELERAKSTNASSADIQKTSDIKNDYNNIKPERYLSPRFDTYERSTEQNLNAGIYNIERSQKDKYNINFNPFGVI